MICVRCSRLKHKQFHRWSARRAADPADALGADIAINSMRRYRVIQWATGAMGKTCLKAIDRAPHGTPFRASWD